MEQTVSQILAQTLSERGVQRAFGMPGGDVLPLLQAFSEEGIDFVLVRDEASAGFMADATWQLTGNPGVCMSTLGPGATNLLSGMTGCFLDRAPVIAITGRVSESLRGVYTHQELDLQRLFSPVVVHGVTLTKEEAGRELGLALRKLDSGRPGPIHLVLPGDVAPAPIHLRFRDPPQPRPAAVPGSLIAGLAQRIAGVRHPILLVGLGALSRTEGLQGSTRISTALTQLAQTCPAPVLTTYKAKGLIDEYSPWCAGTFGLSARFDPIHQGWLEQADLILAIGLDPVELRPPWLPGWLEHIPLLTIDATGPSDLVHPIEQSCIGDVEGTLSALVAELSGRACASQWTPDQIATHRAILEPALDDGPHGPAEAVRALQRGLPEDTILSLDVGAHRITASHVWRCRRPSTLLQSNGLSSMGYGLPAAIAARLALPGRPVVCLTGDMGLWMTLGELGICQERNLDLVVVYFSDRSLALIELKQQRQGLPPVGVRFANPDVGSLAKAFGGVGLRVEGGEALESAAREAVKRGGLTLLEVMIHRSAYVNQV